MASFSQVVKACRSLKFLVVEDPVERFAMKRRMKHRSRQLRMRLRAKKQRITRLYTEWALNAINNVACGWERDSKVKNIGMLWQNEMIGIKWAGKHQEIRAGLRFALLEDIQFVADVMGSVGLQINPRMVEISSSVYLGRIVFESESDWIKWADLVKNLETMV
ncbi:uncharacterized protein LOC131643030 [Vicia villosa]|uniref:uncharacterized protein LOC131608085 n=1 Tax=Vicia villosa TaxID=3911 RepID=UPI00273BDACC|nr:uncharacterized protein LOC131608085 [Vicia villosa]XP_058765102.1 uncharacterized protein LOC131638556 [Vicia villosa]XP_058768486.1 uncharacterized protein LOC131642231 [Vicia villosa]XP_058769163.1 uncharacterized protein LOC131643030 [Vicia villosa]